MAISDSEYLSSVLEAVRDGVLVVDLQGHITRYNRRFAELWGIPESVLALHDDRQAISIVLHQLKNPEAFISSIEKPRANIDREAIEIMELSDDRTFEAAVRPLLFCEEHIGTVWSFSDITKRRKTEFAHAKSDAKFRTLVEQSLIGIYMIEDPNYFTYVNPRMAQSLGYTPAEINLTPISELVVPEDREMVRENVRKRFAGEVASIRYTLRLRHKDGRIVYAEAHGSRFMVDGRPAILGMLLDVSDQKRAQDGLRESENRYRELFESNPHPMWVYDVESLAFLAVNEAAVHHYGYSREDFLSMTIRNIRPPDQVPDLLLRLNNLESAPFAVTAWKHMKKDGSLIDVETKAHSVTWGDHRARLVTVTDVSERKRTEAALHESERQLRQAQKIEAVGQLAGGIAHDFNNLLTVINGRSQVLIERRDLNESLRSEIDLIYRTGERAAVLTKQLLAFSRQEVQQLTILSLNEIVGKMQQMLQRLIPASIDIETVLGPDVCNIKADANQIEQVIINLSVNARDAMPQGGKLTIETANATLDDDYIRSHPNTKPGQYTRLTVSDTGCGMSDAVRTRIFEPFFTTKSVGKGTGLGLSTVYGVVKQTNGSIEVYSEVGKGTTFKVYFPRAEGEAAKRDSSAIPNRKPRGTEVVLLVEDDSEVRALVREQLMASGYTVLTAANGVEALEIEKTNPGVIHLLMTDVVMPQMGGPELATKMKRARPNIRVLFSSGYADRAVMRTGMLDETSHFIQKPFSLFALARKLREVLDAK